MDILGRPYPEWKCAKPLLKWTGGKGSEIDRIGLARPSRYSRLIEPFVGGGAVLFATPACIPAVVNDRSSDLTDLYRALARRSPIFIESLNNLNIAWEALESVKVSVVADDREMIRRASAVIKDMVAIEPDFALVFEDQARRSLRIKRALIDKLRAVETDSVDGMAILASALRAGFYTAVRSLYNRSEPGPLRSVYFWFLREFCYGGMFRCNAAGGMNVPYGGLSYDKRSMRPRIEQLMSIEVQDRLANTVFHQGDFESFLSSVQPGPEDFMFLDPPYDSPFSTYDGNSFTRDDHRRLATAMTQLDCPWMLVISETDFVRATYCSLPGAQVMSFDKGYAVNIKQRFKRDVTHLTITNYTPMQTDEL